MVTISINSGPPWTRGWMTIPRISSELWWLNPASRNQRNTPGGGEGARPPRLQKGSARTKTTTAMPTNPWEHRTVSIPGDSYRIYSWGISQEDRWLWCRQGIVLRSVWTHQQGPTIRVNQDRSFRDHRASSFYKCTLMTKVCYLSLSSLRTDSEKVEPFVSFPSSDFIDTLLIIKH